MLNMKITISVVQVGQHWIDLDTYEKKKWLLSNKGALTTSHKGLLAFGFRLRNTWELITRSFVFLVCVVLLPLHITGNIVAKDDYRDYGMMSLAIIVGLVVFPFTMVEAWYQLKRSNIYCVAGIVQKANKKRWDGKRQYKIKVTGNEYEVGERIWVVFSK